MAKIEQRKRVRSNLKRYSATPTLNLGATITFSIVFRLLLATLKLMKKL